MRWCWCRVRLVFSCYTRKECAAVIGWPCGAQGQLVSITPPAAYFVCPFAYLYICLMAVLSSLLSFLRFLFSVLTSVLAIIVS